MLMAGYVYGTSSPSSTPTPPCSCCRRPWRVCPSRCSRPRPFGAPVVVSDIPPHLEVVGADAPGHRVFASGSEDEAVAALERSLADPTGEQEAAAAFRADVLERYRWDRVVEQTEEVYASILRRG